MEADPAAIPLKPKTAAIIAITRKITVHLNITLVSSNAKKTMP